MAEYTINVDANPSLQWNHVIEKEREPVLALINEARSQIPAPVMWLGKLTRWAFPITGWRQREIDGIADALGVSRSDVALLQLSYELGQVAQSLYTLSTSPLGCTIGIGPTNEGMTHLRTLDWGLNSIRGATRVVRYAKGGQNYYGVTILGFAGLLTGMVPGGYSVAINYATPLALPTLNSGPAFLLRHVLETCRTYEEAVQLIARSRISGAAFFSVCGVKPGQGAVIEHLGKHALIRRLDESVGALAHANHYVTHSWPGWPMDYTLERYSLMLRAMQNIKELSRLKRVLSVHPVNNEITQQRVILIPAEGYIELIG